MNINNLVKNLAPNMKVMKALLLDFDGTIRNSKSGSVFIKNFNDIKLIEGMEEKIWKFRNEGYFIIGISNQGGVAHGFKLPMEIELELKTTIELYKKNPFHIVKMCYHMEDGTIEPYCHRSLLRKPSYGMLAVAEMDAFNNGIVIDWNGSLFVGDRKEDEDCAKSANIQFVHVDNFLID